MKSKFGFLQLLLFVGISSLLQARPVEKILSLKVESSINPATFNYIKTGLERAGQEKADLMVIKLRTPGGLVSTTKDILSLIGQSEIPIAIWVTPEGSSATSAGAILASGAHILVMSEGTNIGAATPIEMSGDLKNKDVRSKAVNDLVALVQSLAETRKRNASLFVKMVQSASSFGAKEANEKKLIDGIVNNDEEFAKFLHGRQIHLGGEDITLEVSSIPEIIDYEMDSGQQLLNIFANPNLAYILFLIGAALLYLEFQAPGGLIAGSLGTVCIVLAGIGFQVLPLNFGALGLIILAFILFIIEMFVTSYGLLTVSGMISLICGSLFLYRTDDSYLSLSKPVIFASVGAIVFFLGIIVYIMVKERKAIGAVKFNAVVGKKAHIIALENESDDALRCYQVQVGGGFWKASSKILYKKGDFCVIKGQENLVLKI